MSEVKTNKISSVSTNGDITLDPDGTGDTIIASGNVGIGKSSSITDRLHIENTGANCLLSVARTDGAAGRLVMQHTSSVGALQTTGSVPLTFGTADTERMRVQANGCVGVGSTDEANTQQFISITSATNTAAVDARSSSTSYTNNVLLVGSNTSTTNSTYNHIRCDIHGDSQRMAVRDSGNVVNANNSYGSMSDSRLKENIVDAASQWDDIKALQIRKYNRLGETQKELGVIAQELETAGMGGLVEEGEYYDVVNNPNEETRKSVKYSILYMKAIKALQEAITKIETLETENTTQATQIADLITRVTALENA